jgi:hypothetical protein
MCRVVSLRMQPVAVPLAPGVSWPERRRRRGAEGPAAPGSVGTETPTMGVMGTGPGPVDRHGWSSARLVMRIR